MSRRLLRRAPGALALGLSLVLGLSGSASAWQPLAPGVVWSGPVRYSLNQNGSIDLGGFAPTEVEVRRAMDDWTLVSCTSLTDSYQGSTSRQAGNFEGQNTVGWIETGWSHGSQAIGVTTTRRGRSFFVEADMEMNGVDYRWQTGPGTFGNVNTYSIALHEGGHFYGLGHTNVRGSSMWPSYGGGIVGLGPDDQNGICALYPGSGSDCTTTGCPSGQECVAGSCQGITGDGTVCSPCTADSDCGGPADLCIGYPDGRSYCGRSCASNADCGGDTCAPLTSGGRQCARVSGMSFTCDAPAPGGCMTTSDCPAGQVCNAGVCGAPPPGAGLGETCASNDACSSGLCLGGTCTQTCDTNNIAGSCPAGFYCDDDPSTCGSGFCTAGTAGGGALGAACSVDTECQSLFCAAGACSQPCVPDGAATCPDGFACQTGAQPCAGSCQQSGALGDMCETNFDCTSGICATLGDLSFCTDFCSDTALCPDNFTCTPAGDSSVCVPDGGGLGAQCNVNTDCVSGICATEADRRYCTRICDEMTPCPPDTFACTPTSDGMTSVCQPLVTPMEEGGCGCRVAGRPGSGLLGLIGALALGLLVWWRRRD